MSNTDKTKTRLETIDEKIQKLENEKKKIIANEKEKERKARTKMLIELGAIVNKYFNIGSAENAELFCRQQIERNDMFDLLEQEYNVTGKEDFIRLLTEYKYYKQLFNYANEYLGVKSGKDFENFCKNYKQNP